MMALAGIWINWLLLGAILHLALTLIGSRGSMLSALNLLAWASLPLAVRGVVHIAFVTSTGRGLVAPGVSGLFPDGESGAVALLANAARGFDLYFLWQVALVAVGASSLGETRRARVWLTVTAVHLGFLMATSVPSYILQQLAGLTVIRPFLF